MPMISPEDQQTLQKLFEGLEGDVTITNFTQRESLLLIPGQECDYCQETRELLEEVTALSEKLHLEMKDVVRDKQEADNLGVTRIPAFVLQGRAKGAVRYFGIPAGYEFSTLVEDLLDVSKGTTNLSDTTREALATVDQNLHIQVFVTRPDPIVHVRPGWPTSWQLKTSILLLMWSKSPSSLIWRSSTGCRACPKPW
jgi:alkyl hydroperoxide reductase subunit AhpF